MKVEQFITRHLYTTKKVSLQYIGSFQLSPDINIPFDSDVEVTLPADSIQFNYNDKEPKDDSLIDSMVLETKKIKSLIASDLESYTILSKQFLNIGKPLHIKGIGILKKNQAGQYEFTQGPDMGSRIGEATSQSGVKEDSDIDFSSQPKNNKRIQWVPFLFIFCSVLALSFFYYRYHLQQEKLIPVTIQDTLSKPTIKDSSNTVPIDTTITSILKDSTHFKVILKEFKDQGAANASYKKLTDFGHVVLLSKDSTNYTISMSFKNALSDTTRIIDSLRKIFGKAKHIAP